mgnify:FL=1
MKMLRRLFTLLLLCLWGQASSLLWADDGYEFRGGTCVLRGQIKNMGTMPKHLTLHLRNLFLNQDANYLVQVRPDGSIQENIPLPHSQFAYWSGLNGQFFLMAGDTVDMVYDAEKGMEFLGNNVTAQVNRYYPALREKFLSEYRTSPGENDSKKVYDDYIDFKIQVFKKIRKEIDRSLPADCLPLTRKILRASLLNEPVSDILDLMLYQKVMPTLGGWMVSEEKPSLDNKKLFHFLSKYKEDFLDNPYSIMGDNARISQNRMTYYYALFLPFGGVTREALVDPDNPNQDLVGYGIDYLLPQHYDSGFLKQAKALRDGALYTYSDFVEEQFQKYQKRTGMDNNFSFQVALCQHFRNAYKNLDAFNIDRLTERLLAIMPYITYPQVRFHLLQFYRQCVREQAVEEEKALENDSVFQRIIRPYAGNVLYIDFWGLGCGPCRAGMLQQREIVEALKGKPVKFLYICNEAASPRESVEAWLKKNQIQGEHIFIHPEDWAYLEAHFQFSGIPFTLIMNKKGKLLKLSSYDLTVEEFEQLANE